MIEHYIFDFDGTVSDSYPIFLNIYHEIAEKWKLPFEADDEQVDKMMKITLKHAFVFLGWERFCTWKNFLEEFHSLQKRYALSFCAFPEAVKLLDSLVANGKKCYLYTHSGSVVKEILLNMGLLDRFHYILDSSHSFPSKPAPDALLFLAKKLGLDPQNCMMIGDRPIDAEAGMNAGMVGCLWDADGMFPDFVPDIRVGSLLDIHI